MKWRIINRLLIVLTSTLYKIPPNLPFPKGGIPLFEKEGLGRFPVMSFLF